MRVRDPADADGCRVSPSGGGVVARGGRRWRGVERVVVRGCIVVSGHVRGRWVGRPVVSRRGPGRSDGSGWKEDADERAEGNRGRLGGRSLVSTAVDICKRRFPFRPGPGARVLMRSVTSASVHARLPMGGRSRRAMGSVIALESSPPRTGIATPMQPPSQHPHIVPSRPSPRRFRRPGNWLTAPRV